MYVVGRPSLFKYVGGAASMKRCSKAGSQCVRVHINCQNTNVGNFLNQTDFSAFKTKCFLQATRLVFHLSCSRIMMTNLVMSRICSYFVRYPTASTQWFFSPIWFVTMLILYYFLQLSKQYNFKIMIGLSVAGKQGCLVKLHSRYLQAPAEGQSKMCSHCVGLSKTVNV